MSLPSGSMTVLAINLFSHFRHHADVSGARKKLKAIQVTFTTFDIGIYLAALVSVDKQI